MPNITEIAVSLSRNMPNMAEITTATAILYFVSCGKRLCEKLINREFTYNRSEVASFFFLGGIEGLSVLFTGVGWVLSAAVLCWKHGVEDEERKLRRG